MEHVLKDFGIEAGVLPIGEGVEAAVYAIDDDRVVKVYKQTGEVFKTKLERIQSFYASLDSSHVDFDVPEIFAVDIHEGFVCSVEKRLHGKDFSTLYDALTPEARQTSLQSYIRAAEELQYLVPEYSFFGEVLTGNPIRSTSWQDFLLQKIEAIYGLGKDTLIFDVPELEEIVAFMKGSMHLFNEATRASLVHGDYYRSNVLMDNNRVTAILDFNDLTLAGDFRMDVASAVIFLGEDSSHDRSDDRSFILNELAGRYGSNIKDVIHFYRLYYSLNFASYCKDTDPTTYAWAVASMKQHLTGDYRY